MIPNHYHLCHHLMMMTKPGCQKRSMLGLVVDTASFLQSYTPRKFDQRCKIYATTGHERLIHRPGGGGDPPRSATRGVRPGGGIPRDRRRRGRDPSMPMRLFWPWSCLSNSQVTALFIPQGLLQHLFHAWLQGLLNNTKWPKPISAPSKIACRSESAGGDRIHFC